MSEQNFKNHARFVFLYHVIGVLLLLSLLIGSIVNVFNSSKENLYSATLILATNFLLGITLYFARSFALKANDRAIRAEENLRHFILTQSALPTGLKIAQIVALRFASDEEFPLLCLKAKNENLSGTEIKKSIQHWKADLERV
jgi:fatty-acid desaturase